MKKIFKTFLIILFIFSICINKIKAENSSGNTSDIQLLARAINGEARGESYEGQVAVGAVIMNRVKHPSFPNTISGVLYESGAFSALTDGQYYNEPIADSAYRAAGWDPTNGCVYYFNPNTATNKWIWSKQIVTTIGKHNFCK